MDLKARIDLMVQLGDYLQSEDEYLQAVLHRVAFNNAWLTKENSLRAAKSLGQHFLNPATLSSWTDQYAIHDTPTPKKVGVVVAEHIPFAGLTDIMAVFLTGHQSLLKVSEADAYTLPHLLKMMAKWQPKSEAYFQEIKFLKGFDAIIATKVQENNRYYEQYFSKYPHILRNPKNSIAVLNGKETDAQLLALGDDVFAYFGLAAANVSKLYVPRGYDFTNLLAIFHEYKEVVLNSRYKNNFDYNYSLLILNKEPFEANGCILLIQNEAIASRIGCLHYEYYDQKEAIIESLKKQKDAIHFIVSETDLDELPTIPMGSSQKAILGNNETETDLIEFLLKI